MVRFSLGLKYFSPSLSLHNNQDTNDLLSLLVLKIPCRLRHLSFFVPEPERHRQSGVEAPRVPRLRPVGPANPTRTSPASAETLMLAGSTWMPARRAPIRTLLRRSVRNSAEYRSDGLRWRCRSQAPVNACSARSLVWK